HALRDAIEKALVEIPVSRYAKFHKRAFQSTMLMVVAMAAPIGPNCGISSTFRMAFAQALMARPINVCLVCPVIVKSVAVGPIKTLTICPATRIWSGMAAIV